MNEAVRTTTSPAGLWVIVSVLSLLTAFLVSVPLVADSVQARIVRRRRRTDERRMGGLGSVPADIGAADIGAGVPGQRTGATPYAEAPYAETPPGEIPTLVDLPAQRGGESDQPAAGRLAFRSGQVG